MQSPETLPHPHPHSHTDPDLSGLEAQLAEWRAEQARIAGRVVVAPDPPPPPLPSSAGGGRFFAEVPRRGGGDGDGDGDDNALYGGVDVSFGDGDDAVAVYVVLRRRRSQEKEKKEGRRRGAGAGIVSPAYELVYSDHVRFALTIPYVSSYLSFREIAPLEELVRRQVAASPGLTPRAILVDGNGVLHPRRAGLACFLGVRTGIPTVGIGKKLCCIEEGWSNGEVETRLGQGLAALSLSLAGEDQVWGKDDSSGLRDRLFFDRSSIRLETSTCAEGRTETDAEEGGANLSSPSLSDAVAAMPPGRCSGYVAYLQSSDGSIVGAALVGHGGSSSASPKVSTKTARPIFISVGHQISVFEAATLCAGLAEVRIPEPVRAADLMGRRLMREKT